MTAAQQDADQAGPPAGVVAAEGERLVTQRLRRGGARAATTVLARGEGAGAGAPAAAQQLANGAGGAAEVAGDGGGGLPPLMAVADGATDGEGDWRWQREPS